MSKRSQHVVSMVKAKTASVANSISPSTLYTDKKRNSRKIIADKIRSMRNSGRLK